MLTGVLDLKRHWFELLVQDGATSRAFLIQTLRGGACEIAKMYPSEPARTWAACMFAKMMESHVEHRRSQFKVVAGSNHGPDTA